MNGTKIIVVVGAIAAANAAMALINPFTPQLSLSTVPKLTSVSTLSVTKVVTSPLAAPAITVTPRSGFTLPPVSPPASVLPPPPPPPK